MSTIIKWAMNMIVKWATGIAAGNFEIIRAWILDANHKFSASTDKKAFVTGLIRDNWPKLSDSAINYVIEAGLLWLKRSGQAK